MIIREWNIKSSLKFPCRGNKKAKEFFALTPKQTWRELKKQTLF